MDRFRGGMVALGAAVVGTLAAGAPAQALGELKIKVKGPSVVAVGKWRPAQDPSIGAAVAAFGEPASRKALGDNGCRVKWSAPQINVVFADFGGGTSPICDGSRAKVQSFTTHDPTFATTRGLYAGASTREARRRHKNAERHGGGLWLYTASLYGRRGPVLSARLNRDRTFVAALKGWVGAAGE